MTNSRIPHPTRAAQARSDWANSGLRPVDDTLILFTLVGIARLADQDIDEIEAALRDVKKAAADPNDPTTDADLETAKDDAKKRRIAVWLALVNSLWSTLNEKDQSSQALDDLIAAMQNLAHGHAAEDRFKVRAVGGRKSVRDETMRGYVIASILEHPGDRTNLERKAAQFLNTSPAMIRGLVRNYRSMTVGGEPLKRVVEYWRRQITSGAYPPI